MTRADQLAEGWLYGGLTDAEVHEFLALLEQDDSPLPPLISSWLEEPSFSGWADPSREDALFQKIMEKGRMGVPLPKTRVIRLTRWRVAAAAAALLLLALPTWLLLHHSPAQNPPALTKVTAPDIAPGGNRAFLTLAGGQKILLDSAANGILARQGSAEVRKLSDGRLAYLHATGTTELVYNTLSTPRGGQYQLTLPDGTRVWLNAASSITYPTTFRGSDRKVTITGEAYFEVAKDARRPFRVTTAGMTVDVLGTQFNINAYADETTLRTTLLTGSVRITRNNNTGLLAPGDQASIARGQDEIRIAKEEDIEKDIAWKKGEFFFYRDGLPAIMRQLSRWYDVEIEYKGSIREGHFSGIISRGKDLSQVLSMLQATGNLHVEIQGRKIIVLP